MHTSSSSRALLIALALAGCGGGAATAPTSNTSRSAAPTGPAPTVTITGEVDDPTSIATEALALPAIADDGTFVVLVWLDDGGRGYPDVELQRISIESGKVVDTEQVLDADAFDSDAPPDLAAAAARANTWLAAEHERTPLRTATLGDIDMGTDPARGTVGDLVVEGDDASLSISRAGSRLTSWLAPPIPASADSTDVDVVCGYTPAMSSLYAVADESIVLVELTYQAPDGCAYGPTWHAISW